MMKIAIPTTDGVLFPHFGHCAQVTIVSVENSVIVGTQILEAPEHAHGVLPQFIAKQGCTHVLCGGLGAPARQMLEEAGLQVQAGAPSLPVKPLVEQYLAGSLVYGDGACHHEGCHHEH